jgi:YegS/Rv2252/BmrU family lipid kinase
MRPLLIVNPSSGGGKTGRTFEQLRGPIERVLGAVDVAFTERRRHATELAREAALAGRETVVAVGGDGSIHEVVSGLMQARERDAKSTRLGIIGQGTGGDFCKTLGLEHRLDKYCAAIAAGRTRTIDVGRFTHADDDAASAAQTAWFVNILSLGIGGLVDRYVADSSRALGGTMAYFAASVRGLLDSAVGVLACRIEDGGIAREEEIRTRSMAICNGRFFGSGMQVAPMAQPDDGRFEVVDLGSASRLRFAAVSSKMYSGTHVRHPDVRHFRCTKMTIELQNRDVRDRFLLDVDGEPFGRLPIEVTVVPGALEVLC